MVIFQIHETKMKIWTNINQNMIIQKNKRDNKNITILAAINSDGLIHNLKSRRICKWQNL